jgi:hypothetical protein
VATYEQLIADLPLPTPEQCHNFAEHVMSAHSWYKKLPLLPPGAPFAFLLNHGAGRQVVEENGQRRFQDITDPGECWHYSMVLTSEYRERFGHWDYTVLENPFYGPGKADVSVPGPDLEEAHVPEAILAACSCRLTAFVSAAAPLSSYENDAYLRYLKAHPNDPNVARYRALVQPGPATATFREEEHKRQRELVHATVLGARDFFAGLSARPR